MSFQADVLDVMLKYRCRILFTTRSRYENHISLEVGELNTGTLLELAARLLANGLLTPKALLTKLQKEKAALDAEDKIGTTKDGRNKKATAKNTPAWAVMLMQEYFDLSLFTFYQSEQRPQTADLHLILPNVPIFPP